MQQEVAAKKILRAPSQMVVIDGIDLKVGEIEGFLGGEAPVAAVNHFGISVKGASLDLEAQVNGISIDQVLERNFDGHHIRIRIQAQCEPFSLRVAKGGVIGATILGRRQIKDLRFTQKRLNFTFNLSMYLSVRSSASVLRV